MDHQVQKRSQLLEEQTEESPKFRKKKVCYVEKIIFIRIIISKNKPNIKIKKMNLEEARQILQKHGRPTCGCKYGNGPYNNANDNMIHEATKILEAEQALISQNNPPQNIQTPN